LGYPALACLEGLIMGCREIVEENLGKDGDRLVLRVIVHPNSSRQGIRIEDGGVHVYVNEPPHEGRANQAVLKLLRKKYGIKASIVQGYSSRAKTLEIRGQTLGSLVSILCGASNK